VLWIENSPLLDLPFSGIVFPAEDANVELSCQPEEKAQPDLGQPADDDSPRASLEALSRLHQDLIHEESIQQDVTQEEVTQEEVTQEESTEGAPIEQPERAPDVDVVAARAERAIAPAVASTPEEAIEVVAEVVDAPTQESNLPRHATELLDVAIRMFPPSKAGPQAGLGLAGQMEPLLPRLKGLPLRPKVAVATGYAPPAANPAQPKASPQPQTKAKETPAAPTKAAPAAKPAAARIAQPKQPGSAAKSPSSAPAKPASKFQAPSQPTVPKAPAATTIRAEGDGGKGKTAEPVAKPSAVKEEPVVVTTVKSTPAQAKPLADEQVKPAEKPAAKAIQNESAGESGPNFGAMQLPNSSFAGSLKVKLGIAIVLLVGACSLWLGWGGKSKQTVTNSAVSADGSGPSIILGEGGWVEGWAGDPSNSHSGRQITLYRPSIKLSDYRIEFQGTIETQSIGWVFRAADPGNYYALKLMAVSAGLTPKLALFKYLVINGRQTQVGRVPIDLTLRTDSVFKVRTDVRGPQFSTYIQGQQVDVWTDDQLKAGGVGFLNERDERGKVKSVSIRYLNGAAK
jgi:hypothetical protein